MSASEMKEFRKYKKDKRLELNKQYPKGGKAFIKAVNALGSLNLSDYKALLNKGVKPVPKTVVASKINSSKKPDKNIVKIKNNIKKTVTENKKEDKPQPTKMPQSIKEMRAKNKAKEEAKDKIKKEVKNDSKKDITKMRTSDVKMVTLKSGKKGTIKQRMAELDADKEKAQRAKNSPKTNKALDAVFAMIKKTKEKNNVTLKNGGMTMKKKTKYMAKGGYGTPTKKMVMKAGGTAKKTKYMAKGGMKKTKYMAKGGVAKKK